MAYSWALIDDVFVVRWAVLNVHDLDKILNDLTNASKSSHQAIKYISITPAEAPVPSKEERTALGNFAAKAEPFCSGFEIVFEGDSLKHTLQRTVITTALMLVQRSGKAHIHKKLEDAVGNACKADPTRADSVMTRLRLRGLARPA